MMSKKSPELRFKGFTDDWEQRKLEDYSEKTFGGGTPKTGIDEYWTGDIPWIQSSDLKKEQLYNVQPSKFITDDAVKNSATKLVPKNSIAIVTRVGVGKLALLPFEYATSQDFLSLSNLKVDKWFGIYSTYIMLQKELNNIQGTSIKGITKPELLKKKMRTPSLIDEQSKIGTFFKQLDDIIALHQRKLDLLKEQKKGFLQKMFPKNGAKVPELRFKGFTDDWEERKLGESSDVRDGTHASPKYVSQGHPMVTSKNLTHFGLDMTDVSFLTDKDFNEINKRSKVSIGDILFGMIGTIGNPVIVDRDDFAIKNVALIKEKTSNPITNKWLLQYLKSPSFNRFIQKENAGGTQKFISLGLIRDMKLRVPEFDEQQKIGAFFKQLDDTIALHQRKLDLLKEQKKGFLQKMFV
ncbi:Type I restriction-modification system, specificity subunit S [Streptococcus thermophilus]|nr:restriction endonuclease subunit S [Streptococcus thermophilus]CAD0171122.1 Type I restriction-modification system, specificity subunit S [Streptococcus thermophilus]